MADNDALLTNQMPHSPEAEQAVLGSMLIDADCVKDVMDQLQTQDFYLRTNRDIFETIYPDVRLLQAHRRRHRGGRDGEKRQEQRADPFLSGAADGGNAHQRQRYGVRPHRAGEIPACGRWPLPPGASPPWCSRAPAAPATCWRQPSSGSMPSAGAAAPRAWCP